MPGHATATYGHSGQFLAKLHGKLSPRIARAIHKNTVKNSKNRRLFWSCVAETRCFFFLYLSSPHTHRRFAACCKLKRENMGKYGGGSWVFFRLAAVGTSTRAGRSINNSSYGLCSAVLFPSLAQ